MKPSLHLLQSLPGQPFVAEPGCSVLMTSADEFYRLPRKVQDAIQAYHTRSYTNGSHVWVEVADYRVEELQRMMEALQ